MINVFDLSCFRNPFAKFDQSKGLEGEKGAGSQIKGLKQTLFRIVPNSSQSLTSGPRVDKMDYIFFRCWAF